MVFGFLEAPITATEFGDKRERSEASVELRSLSSSFLVTLGVRVMGKVI